MGITIHKVKPISEKTKTHRMSNDIFAKVDGIDTYFKTRPWWMHTNCRAAIGLLVKQIARTPVTIRNRPQ